MRRLRDASGRPGAIEPYDIIADHGEGIGGRLAIVTSKRRRGTLAPREDKRDEIISHGGIVAKGRNNVAAALQAGVLSELFPVRVGRRTFHVASLPNCYRGQQ